MQIAHINVGRSTNRHVKISSSLFTKSYHANAYYLNKDKEHAMGFAVDIWEPKRNDFLGWEEARNRLSLAEVHYGLWFKLLEHYAPFYEKMWNQHGAQPILTKWFGLYENLQVATPKWVASARYAKEFRYGLVQFSTKFMSFFLKFIVAL